MGTEHVKPLGMLSLCGLLYQHVFVFCQLVQFTCVLHCCHVKWCDVSMFSLFFSPSFSFSFVASDHARGSFKYFSSGSDRPAAHVYESTI